MNGTRDIGTTNLIGDAFIADDDYPLVRVANGIRPLFRQEM